MQKYIGMRYHGIEENSMLNGSGMRIILWVSGCFHNCQGCQNPSTHDPKSGMVFDERAEAELIEALSPDYISGLTLSGGDPMCYYEKDVMTLVQTIRDVYGDKKTIWLYTGFNFESFISEMIDCKDGSWTAFMNNIDVICDGMFIEKLADINYHWVGSRNQRVVDVKRTLSEKRLVYLEEDQGDLCTTDDRYLNLILHSL